ncbi:MAG: DUF4476 domain-containing protein [Sphingobacteriales bacterium]|nr:DUF4476 domain-containing protein [Sphingobacteriales bacterium]
MKKFMLLSAVILNTFSAQPSQLTVRMFNYAGIVVSLDRNNFSEITSQHTFRNVYPGYHLLEVKMVSPEGWHHHQKIYSDYIFIPANTNVYAVIDPHFNLHISQQKMKPHYPPPHRFEENKHSYDNHHEFNHMNDKSFMLLYDQIRNESFDANKIKIIRHALKYNYFSSMQIYQMLTLFTFDSYRLEAAKASWHSVSDPENFYIVYQVFTFRSNAEELEEYILRN